jgi:hypothetical protein
MATRARCSRFSFQAATCSSVHITAFGRLPESSSTKLAGLTVISCSCLIARFNALRSVARIRYLVAAPMTRRPLTAARWAGSPDARAARINSFSASMASNVDEI